MIRAFVAIEIPEDIRAAIEQAQRRLKRAPLSVKVAWVKTSNLHMTLQFLGHVGEEKIELIKTALDLVAGCHDAFDWTVRGAGAFPGDQRPRVLWVGGGPEPGVGEEAPAAGSGSAQSRLAELAGSVRGAMQDLGFEPERRPFTAHVTIARIRHPRPDPALTKALGSTMKDTVFGSMRVNSFHLVQSQLDPGGSVYTKLSTFPLGRSAHDAA